MQDVPEALELSKIRSRHGNGPYTTKNKFDWDHRIDEGDQESVVEA